MPTSDLSATSENSWSKPIQIIGGFNLSISGVFSATVTVQRSKDGETWRDVETWAAPYEGIGCDPILNYYRVGVASGDYTSGTVAACINGYDTWPPRG